MDEFDEICEKIRKVEIQGATNVARAAVRALRVRDDPASIRKLVGIRSTEPELRNVVKFVKDDPHALGKKALEHMDFALGKIAEYGARLIEDGMIVFTHCHSSAIVGILKEAKRQGRKFEVYNTETRPLFQGRKTAKELSSLGIKVTHFVDSAARVALRDADVFLFGADAITSEGKIANKIGTELFAETARGRDVDCYSCTDSWKFDPDTIIGKREEIEIRSEEEVWKGKPEGVKVMNLAFELVDPKLVTGIISELGVYTPAVFVQKVIEAYPWLVKDIKA